LKVISNPPRDVSQQRKLLLELQKWKTECDKLKDELAKRTTEFEDYRKNSVPLSIQKPV
jgi:hypothetical protein